MNDFIEKLRRLTKDIVPKDITCHILVGKKQHLYKMGVFGFHQLKEYFIVVSPSLIDNPDHFIEAYLWHEVGHIVTDQEANGFVGSESRWEFKAHKWAMEQAIQRDRKDILNHLVLSVKIWGLQKWNENRVLRMAANLIKLDPTFHKAVRMTGDIYNVKAESFDLEEQQEKEICKL